MGQLAQWVEAINRGGMFARRTRHDLALIERQTAHEWAAAYSRKSGRQITQITSGFPGRLPDCFAQLDGRKISLELTELIDRAALQARRAGTPGWFEMSQWSMERIDSELLKRISAKQSKCSAQSGKLDALIIHTDEPWLHPSAVEEWLDTLGFDASKAPNIRSAWLLQSHSWRLHQIFGGL